MKKTTLLILAVLLTSLFQAPLAQAYVTTSQTAFTTNGKMAVYVIKFELGHGSHDIHVPVQAMVEGKIDPTNLSYVILDDEMELAKGESIGLVLSSLPAKDGMYIVPKGTKATFSLLAFYTPSPLETESHFRLQVTSLPFSFNGTQKLQLNESELKKYTTELLPLKK